MENYKFDATKTTDELISWIKNYFKKNGTEKTKAVIGISGGKDSSVCASLCVKALGADRVIGVKMPDGEQEDIDYSNELIEFLGIKSYEINIGEALGALYQEIPEEIELNDVVTTNTPARIRMSTLYAVSGAVGGRVCNTCNLSEDYIGYATKQGDAVGDFSPLSKLTVQEVKAIGTVLGLPKDLIEKTPTDGLCGQTDEDKIGFSYETLDHYIRIGGCSDINIANKIDAMHEANMHKLLPMPSFDPAN